MKIAALLLWCLALSAGAATNSVLPDPRLTPGKTMMNVDVEVVTQKGYANKLNGGARHVTEAEKREVFVRYFGAVPAKPGDYEVDHLIPVILGGSNEVENLWPQAYAGSWGVHTKDRLEVRLMSLLAKDLKANGRQHAAALLVQFQAEIAADWTAAYKKYVGGGAVKRSLSHLKKGVE